MKNFLLIFCLLEGMILNSQDLPQQLQQQLENLAGMEVEEDEQFLLYLEELRRHPLNINSVSADQLVQTRMLTPLQAEHLVRYRGICGDFIDIHELQAVPYWEPGDIKRILPFLVCRPVISLKENIRQRAGGGHHLLVRWKRSLKHDGSNKNFLGDGSQVLFRYRYQFRNLLYVGITGEKDAGEPLFKGPRKTGFDFYSFHLFVRDLGIVKAVALGDYTLNLGQGLLLWQGMGFSKSSEVLNVKRQAPAIMPYRSSGEFYFNRGAAINLASGHWESTLFFSARKLSANTSENPGSFSSISSTGLHRNATELGQRKQLPFLMTGGSLHFRGKNFRAGVNGLMNRFGLRWEKKDEPYNFFSFSGRQLVQFSFDYNYTYRNIHVFGETAADHSGNLALIHGAILSAGRKIDMSVLFRNLHPSFAGFFGNAFTENTLPANEKGLYLGLSFRPGGAWQFNAYMDLYRFPWLKFRVNAPSVGRDYLMQWSYRSGKQFEGYIRFRSETKQQNLAGEDVIPYPHDQPRQNLRIHLAYQVNPALSLRSRVETVWFNRRAEEGFLAFVEARVKAGFRWDGNLRLQFFETNGFNSRIYAYESDVLYSYSIPPASGKGFRYYLNFDYKLRPGLMIWLRWAQTVGNETGSQEIKAQVVVEL